MKTAEDLLQQTTRKPLLTEELKNEIKKAITMGIRNADIADYFNVSRARVSQIKKEM